MRKWSALLLVTLLPLALAADVPEYPAAGRHVFDAAALREAGVVRLSDVFRLIDDWNLTTIDGYTSQVSPIGQNPFAIPYWTILVDGQPLDLSAFGTANVNRVPVSLGEIDSIVVLTLPEIHEGQFVDGGLIHIHTRETRGLTLRARAMAGNETGDPGPYRYTAFSSPNVDKVGPNFSVDAAYGTGSTFVRAGLVKQRHYATDAAALERNVTIGAGAYPQLNVIGPSLKIATELFGTRHELFAAYSTFEDLYFLKPFGRELPVHSRFTHVGVRGELFHAGAMMLCYRAAYSGDELDYRGNSLGLGFDWMREDITGTLELSHSRGDVRGSIGVGIKTTGAKTHYRLREDRFSLAHVYGDLDLRLSPDRVASLGVSLLAGGGDAAGKVSVGQVWQLEPWHTLTLAFAYIKRLPEEDRRIWYWDERGYGFLEDAGVTVKRDNELGASSKFTADLLWSVVLTPTLGARLGGFYRDYSGLYVEEQWFQFIPSDKSFAGPVRLHAGQQGGLAGASVAFDWRSNAKVKSALYYRYQGAVGADSTLERVWDAVPSHHARHSITYTPVPGFALYAALNYIGGSLWADYRDVEAQSNGLYRQKVDPAFTVDFAVEKWFWQRRFRGSLVFRNLFNEELRYHPIGASTDLTAFLHLELLLGP